MKHLLQDPGNVHDLLVLCDLPFLLRLDSGRMTVDPTTYASADFRHVSSDLVRQIPFRSTKGRGKRWLTLTILIEHQSQPDRLMTLRALDYVVQIYKSQVRPWGEEHGSLAGVRLRPVLPIIFYTGTHAWERLGTLTDLMTEGATFADVTPAFTPLFIDLSTLPPAKLGRSFWPGVAILPESESTPRVIPCHLPIRHRRVGADGRDRTSPLPKSKKPRQLYGVYSAA